MGDLNFSKYLIKFESEVVCKGVDLAIIGKPMQVNVREGRLSCSKYARLLGKTVDSSAPFIVDYYGYMKRSSGFIKELDSKRELIKNRQIKSIQTKVVFFASLKIEEIAEITSSRYLRGGFSDFKKNILQWRGFDKKPQNRRGEVN